MKDTRYYKSTSRHSKHNKAISDIKNYLGDKYPDITKALAQAIEQDYTESSLVTSIAFLIGIEGYPVYAWIDETCARLSA